MRLSSATDPAFLVGSIAGRRARYSETVELDDHIGVLRHVVMHRNVPRDVLRQDAGDALELICLLRAQLDDLEHDVIRLARATRLLTWSSVATRIGLRNPQAAEQRFLRLANARADPDGRRIADDARPSRGQRIARWLAENADRAAGLARAITELDLPDPDAEDSAATLAEILAEAAPSSRDLMQWLNIVANELRNSGSLGTLPADLRAAFTELLGDWAKVTRPARPKRRLPGETRRGSGVRHHGRQASSSGRAGSRVKRGSLPPS